MKDENARCSLEEIRGQGLNSKEASTMLAESKELRTCPRIFMKIIVLAAWIGMFFLTSLPALSSQAVEKRQSAEAADLDSLLKKMADYCRKLEAAALDFICREEIAERIDWTLDARAAGLPSGGVD
jgi:hypothetical protein